MTDEGPDTMAYGGLERACLASEPELCMFQMMLQVTDKHIFLLISDPYFQGI